MYHRNVPRTDPGFVGLEDDTILWPSLQKEYEITNTKLYIIIYYRQHTTIKLSNDCH
jgi:hypothetical protein